MVDGSPVTKGRVGQKRAILFWHLQLLFIIWGALLYYRYLHVNYKKPSEVA